MLMLTIQPKDDALCTVKRKTKSNKKRNAVECWYECSKWPSISWFSLEVYRR